MAVQHCAWCRSVDTQHGFDLLQCLSCGLFTHADGSKAVATSQANEGVTVADITPPVTAEPVATPAPVVDAAPEQAQAEVQVETPVEAPEA